MERKEEGGGGMMVQQPQKKKPKRSVVWQYKQLEEWTKEVLMMEMVDSNSIVMEIFCGKGHALGKWQRNMIKGYVGCDPLAENIFHTKRRWAASFQSMDSMFHSEEKARKTLSFVSNNLKKGGFFFGLMPDSSTIWYRAQKGESSRLNNFRDKLFEVSFQCILRDGVFFGNEFRVKYDGEIHQHFLVHFPTLIKLCREFNLRLLEIENLTRFYESHRLSFSYLLKEMNVLDKNGKILEDQMKLAELFTTFVFEKISEDE